MTIRKSELKIIGHWKGITQYDFTRKCIGNNYPQKLIVFELNNNFYLQTYNLEEDTLNSQILDTLLFSYNNNYNTACLGLKIEVAK